jgi:peptidoglycan hydrolase CwlO-like protein
MTAPVGEPPLDALPPDAPATVEDIRTNRRWTLVAFAWAIAASAIAVIALIQAGKDNGNSQATTTQTTQSVSPSQLDDFKNQTNDRLDAFSRRLNDTAAQADVQKLDKRLSTVEDDQTKAQTDAGKQTDAITQLQSDVKDLKQRVSDLESKQQNQQNGTTTTP